MRVIIYTHVRLLGELLVNSLESRREDIAVSVCHRAEKLAGEVSSFIPELVVFDMTKEWAIRDAGIINNEFPNVRLVALAIPEIADDVIACADAGFVGYVPYDASLDELYEVICSATKGESRCHPKIARSLFQEVRRRRARSPKNEPLEPLTHRESEVLSLVADGLSNKEIARELSLSVATVKNHLHSVFTKLQVKGRAGALARLRHEPWLASSAETPSPWGKAVRAK